MGWLTEKRYIYPGFPTPLTGTHRKTLSLHLHPTTLSMVKLTLRMRVRRTFDQRVANDLYNKGLPERYIKGYRRKGNVRMIWSDCKMKNSVTDSDI